MKHLIDKSALVAEIEKRKAINERAYMQSFLNSNDKRDSFGYKVQEDNNILSFIDTLEVKKIRTEEAVKLLFENNDRIYDEYGNYYYKNSENDYRFYHKIDEDIWDEDRLSLSEVTERLFSVNSIEVKEVDLESEIKKIQKEYKTIDEYDGYPATIYANGIERIAKHFFELGLKAQKGEL